MDDVHAWAALLSIPAATIMIAYSVGTWIRFVRGEERLPHALVAALSATMALGLLLRPAAAVGLVGETERSVLAIGVRTLIIIIGGGLLWNLWDKLRDTDHWRHK